MKKRILLAALVMLCLFTLSACGCEHEWVEASCTTPKTCVKCEKTEGEPFGHAFLPASCTNPQICYTCGATNGTPKGHTPGQWVDTIDFSAAKLLHNHQCAGCSTILESEEEAVSTFVQDNMFRCSPKQFLDRLITVLTTSYGSRSYAYRVDPTQENLTVNLYFSGTLSWEYSINFLSAFEAPLSQDAFETPGFWGVIMTQINSVSSDSSFQYVDADLFKAFCQACDPALTQDDLKAFSLVYLVTLMNWVDFGDHIGYHEQNELFYAFGHYCIPDGDLRYDVSTYGVYASNWKQDS